MKYFSSRSLLIAAVALIVSIPMVAQQTSGSISGTVTDPSDAVMAGVEVKLTNLGTGITQTRSSDNAGVYRFLLLPPGHYRMEAERAGFKNFSREDILVEINRSVNVPIVMSVGQVSEKVVVSGGADLLEPETSTLGTVMDQRKIEDLPLNGRNPMGLANLIPTVRGIGYFGGEILSTWRMGQLVIAGSSPLNNGYLIDGIANEKLTDYSAMAFLPVDATSEFKVQTNAMSAEYGRTGGGVVSVVSKSGNNQYHGLLFEYLRNTLLNSNEFFTNKAGSPRLDVKVNTFGGTFAGPVKKDKLFFFVNAEGFIERRAASLTTSSPDDLQRSGDFSQTFNSSGQLIAIYDPNSTVQDPSKPSGNYIRTPYAGNKIPASQMSPIAQNVLKYYPKPNLPGLPFTHAQNLFLKGPTPINKSNVGIKMDYNLSPTRRISGRYSRDVLDWGFTNYFNNIADTDGRHIMDPRRTAVLEYTDTFSPTLLLNARIGVNREQEHTIAPGHNFDVTTLGFSQKYASQIQYGEMGVGFPAFSITDGASFGRPDSTGNPTATGTANVTVTKMAGKHSIKSGYEQRLYRRSDWGTSNSSGSYGFARSWTQANPLAASTTSGYGVATFVLGIPTSGTVGIQTDSVVSMNYSALFIQDDWKVSRRLTLNLGLRWEYEGPMKERRNIFPNIDLTVPTGLKVPGMPTLMGGYVWPATNGMPNGLTGQNFKNFGPRVGFAYQASAKTVVRGGYGISYIPTFGPGGSAAGAGLVTSSTMQTSSDGGLTPYTTLTNPFPDGITQPTGNKLGTMTGVGTALTVGQLRYVERGYSQQWNVTVQHQPWNNWLFEGAWVANHGVHLTMGGQPLDLLPDQYLSLGSGLTTSVPNPFYGYITGTGTTLQNPTVTQRQLLLPYPQFLSTSGGSVYRGNSIFHALTFKVEKRFSRGFSILASYTFSKLLDDLGSTGRPGAITGTGIQDWWNLRLERSPSYQDIPQRVVITGQWQIPFKSQDRILKALFGGWQINGMNTMESGRPITPAAAAVTGSNATRPNRNPGVSVIPASQDLYHWFNNVSCATDPAHAAFCQPPNYTYGNAPRTLGEIRGPSFFNLDASVFKTFPIKERYNLQFRTEAFNMTNTPQFEPPSGNISSATYGVVTATITPAHTREIQFALRLTF